MNCDLQLAVVTLQKSGRRYPSEKVLHCGRNFFNIAHNFFPQYSTYEQISGAMAKSVNLCVWEA